MKIFGLKIMTQRAYDKAVGDCFEIGRTCGRVAERYGLPPATDEEAASRRREAADRSRQRRRRGHLRVVAADDIA